MTSTLEAKMIGIEAANNKLLVRLGEKGRKTIAKANETSANEFYELVRRIVPVDERAATGEHLVDTLTKFPVGQLNWAISIGNQTVRYPLHLETGHRMPDGSHVPGKPYWFPAIRVMRKKNRDRVMRAYRKAIRDALAGGN